MNKIVKYAGLSLAIAAIASGASLKLYDDSFDHTKGICPLESILGSEHQINKIKEAGYDVEYKEGYSVPKDYILETIGGEQKGVLKVMPAQYDFNGDGIIDETVVPEGFTYDGKYITNTVDAKPYELYTLYKDGYQANHLYKTR